jgi:hypothetical protein
MYTIQIQHDTNPDTNQNTDHNTDLDTDLDIRIRQNNIMLDLVHEQKRFRQHLGTIILVPVLAVSWMLIPLLLHLFSRARSSQVVSGA